ncbi:MAG TPA: HlyD family secretion protein [Bryobacteraceae bacterium]|nr:HlyD family secretion protein [Bryobacteraceae bacterium]
MATLEREDDKTPVPDDTREDRKAERDDEDQSGQPQKKKRVRLIVFAVLILAAIAAIPIYNYYTSRESTDDAQINGHIVPISPRISGTVIAVLVNDNQYVTAGTELVRLDPADYKVALDKAQADLADAEAQTIAAESNVPITSINTLSQIKTSSAAVIEARAGVTSAQQQVNAANARLASAKAKVAEAQANSEKAQKDLVRYKSLVDKDEISKQQYDSAVAASQSMAAQVDTAQAGVTEAQHNVDVAQAMLGQARARLNSAQVDQRQSQQSAPKQQAAIEARYKAAQAAVQQKQTAIEQAKLNLGYTVLRAPVSGLVSKKNAEPGMIVAPGQQLMAIVPLDDIWVTANFKETQLNRMRVGQQVEIDVDAYGGRSYRGHVDSIAAASGAKFSLLPPENATGNYVKVVQRVPVKIVLDPGQNQDHILRPGMSVVPTVLLNSK